MLPNGRWKVNGGVWRHCSNLNINLNGNETIIQLAFCIQDCPCPSCFIFDLGIQICQNMNYLFKNIFYKLGQRELNHAATRAACTFQFHKIWSEENPRNAPRFQCWCGQIKGGTLGEKTWLGNGPFPLFATGDKTNQTMYPVRKGGAAVQPPCGLLPFKGCAAEWPDCTHWACQRSSRWTRFSFIWSITWHIIVTVYTNNLSFAPFLKYN